MNNEDHGQLERLELNNLKGEIRKLEARMEAFQAKRGARDASLEERVRALEAHDLFDSGYSEAAKEAQKAFMTKIGIMFGGLQAVSAVITIVVMLYLR